MWTVIYIAKSKDTAKRLKELLAQKDILVRLRPLYDTAVAQDGSIEVLVPESEVAQAHEVIIDTDF